jgi:uncharacterized Zn finger protein
MKPKNIKHLQVRARQLQAHIIDRRTIVVESTTTPTANHVVTLDYDSEGTIRARCTCPWALNGGLACTHVLAALDALAARRGRALSFWSDYAEARRQKHRTFRLAGKRNQDDDGLWITSRAA